MICECQLLTKKRTLLDGIKSITGTLILFKIKDGEGEELYMKRCCFMLLVPSLYTFVDKAWVTSSDTIVYNPSFHQAHQADIDILGKEKAIYSVVRVKQSTLQRLQTLGDYDFVVSIIVSAGKVVDQYERIANNLDDAHRRVMELEHTTTDLKFKYQSAVQENYSKQTNLPKLEDIKQNTSDACKRCEDIKSLKTTLKELKRKSHDDASKLQYELDVSKVSMAELQRELKKSKEEIAKLKEINKSLYMNR